LAVIEFVNGKNQTFKGMRKAIDYITNLAKTEPHLIDGHNCDSSNAYNQFVMTKRLYNKETGRQHIHFTQNFAPYDKVTPEDLKNIADELLEMEAFKGFEIVYAVHTDTAHLHTHFVLNTVNRETGYKWRQSAEGLQNLKDYSDELCRKRGLIITHGKTGNYKKRGEYSAKAKGQSWKHELYLAAREVKRNAKNKEDFINNMNKLGYKVNWSDTRKNITFTTPGGKKCRDKKMHASEQFTKDALMKTFDINRQRESDFVLDTKMELMISSMCLVMSNEHQGNIKNNPFTAMEGEELKELMAEHKKGKGLDWDKEKDAEM